MKQLTSKQRAHLRRLAHHLKPVVQIGVRGVTAEVLRATVEQLGHHELIKVRATGADREEVREAADRLSADTGAEVAQIIGKVILLYKAREDEPEIVLPG